LWITYIYLFLYNFDLQKYIFFPTFWNAPVDFHWKNFSVFSLSGYDIPGKLLQYSGDEPTSTLIISLLLYLIPVFAAYNIFKDFTQSKKLKLLNEFIVGIIASGFILLIAIAAEIEGKGISLKLGFYTTMLFSILGLFSKYFSSYKFPAIQNRETGSVQKGMLYQEAGNYSEAFICFYEAAKQNDMIAHNRLGELYEKGLGVEKNINMALKWYEKAATLGDEEAKMRMEILIKRGKSENSDRQEN
jgi:tetratricopeptide (TPR) repeat protein